MSSQVIKDSYIYKGRVPRFKRKSKWWNGLLQRRDARFLRPSEMSPYSHIEISYSLKGTYFNCICGDEICGAAISIDEDELGSERTKFVMDHLYAQADAIERAFGPGLEWGPSWSVVGFNHFDGVRIGDSRWPGLQSRVAADMKRLHNAVAPYLAEVAKQAPALRRSFDIRRRAILAGTARAAARRALGRAFGA